MLKQILIDPGHAPGNSNGGRNGYKEYAGMWKLSNYLKTALEAAGFFVALTRSEYENTPLTTRGRMAEGYDLFISQHSNASADGVARGVEVFYSVNLPGDRAFAAKISKAVSGLMQNPDRGAKIRESRNNKEQDYYTVIGEAQRAGAVHVFLVENGFDAEPRTGSDIL